MRRWMVGWTVAAAALMLAQSVAAVQEVDLDRAGLRAQAEQNRALRNYLKRNGYPDVAQVRPLTEAFPWDNHEVTLYYLGEHKEISFARARILGHTDIHTTRYQRTMTDADVQALQGRVGKLDAAEKAPEKASEKVASAGPCTGNATARAECAATRAENAADRIDAAATQTEQAADRTEALADKADKMTAKSSHHRNQHHRKVASR